MVLPNLSVMLPKFVHAVTKFDYGVTDVFDVTIISQYYICIWQSSIIYIRAANKLLPRQAVFLIEKALSYILQHNL